MRFTKSYPFHFVLIEANLNPLIGNIGIGFLITFLLVCCSTASPLFGQDRDSTFFYIFDNKGLIRTGVEYEDIEIRFFADGERAFEFENSGLSLPVGGRIGILSFSYGIPLANLSRNDTDRGRSRTLNLQLYQKRYFLQASARRISGFQSKDQDEGFRDDMTFTDVSFYGFKVFNPQLSLKASFKNSNKQTVSQGSWLGAINFNTRFLTLDSLNVKVGKNDSEELTIDRYQQFGVGIGAGYAYTFLFGKNWFVTPVVTAGPELRLLRFRKNGTDDNDKAIRVGGRFLGRAAFGYNGNRLFAALTYFLIPGQASSQELNTRVQDNRINLRLGLRL